MKHVYFDKEKVVLEYLPKIKRIAYDLKYNLPPNVDVDDLIQEGVLALLSSLDRYNPKKGSLSTFVVKRIRGAMLDYLRKIDWMPRNLRRNIKDVENAMIELETKGGEVTDEAIAEIVGIDAESVRHIRNEMVRKQMLMLDSYLSGQDVEPIEVIEQPQEEDPEQSAYKELLMEELKKAINKLDDREKLVLSLRYEQELSLKEIGVVLGVSESRVSQVLSVILAKLKRELEGLV
ncbi:MAG: FliA/WhiG family RNA polymerase sigma factor [Thermotogaceae bacterium]|nr:FliA/WhiG family RNA polymerase sigma factor [Thermotogaceae bacterium]